VGDRSVRLGVDDQAGMTRLHAHDLTGRIGTRAPIDQAIPPADDTDKPDGGRNPPGEIGAKRATAVTR
jgi:hypothetical protein